jgi:hypothetical protein
MTGVTFCIPGRAYLMILDAAPALREALKRAASFADGGVWIIDVTEEAAKNVEDWFAREAAVECAQPTPDASKMTTLATALRAIHDGRAKSRRQQPNGAPR